MKNAQSFFHIEGIPKVELTSQAADPSTSPFGSARSLRTSLRMTRSRQICLAAATAAACFVSGCGGSGSKPAHPAITVSLASPPSTLTANSQAQLTANVGNDSANGGVKWTATCGSSGACGSFSSASTASGASTTYTAPAAVPSGNTVTVTATSVTDASKSATAMITITAATGPMLADGTYVYHLAGQNANGPLFLAGAFTVASGGITAGEQDFSDSAAAYSNSITSTGSGVSMGSGGNVQVALATGNTNIGDNGVITLRGTKTSATRVLISEYDGYGVGTGSIDLQTSTAAPAGSYAYLVSGVGFDTNGDAITTGIGGVLNISGTTVSLSNSVFDLNFGSTVSLAKSFTAGTVSAPDSFGRFSIGLSPDTTTGLSNFILTGYVVGPNQVQLIESQQDDLGFNLAGMALAQGSNAGSFNQNALAGKAYVYSGVGADVVGAADFAGVIHFAADGTLSGPLAINDITNNGEDTITGGTYTVGANGRVTLNDVTTQSNPLNGNYAFLMYLDGNGNALMMGADTVEVSAGPAYLQTTSSPQLGGLYAIVGQGFLNDGNGSPWSASGALTINGSNYAGFTDYNDMGTPTPNVTLRGSVDSSSDVLTLTGLNAVSFTGGASFLNYPIDNNRVVTISIDQAMLGMLQMEAVSQ